MTTLDAIAIVAAALLLIDLMLTVTFTRGGEALVTCIHCDKKFTGTVLVAMLRHSVHRCDDNLL